MLRTTAFIMLSFVILSFAGLFVQSSPASARCVWYGPGSGPMPPCYHPQRSNPTIGLTNCAQTAGQPSQCKNWKGGKTSKYSYGGITYLAPGAQKTGTGYMARGCRKTAFGIACNAQKTSTGFMGANCRHTPFGIQCSDMRLKHDIVRVGTAANGLALYRFKYLWSEQAYVGVMAQEVLAMRPDAVIAGSDGYLRVNYVKLGVPFETWRQWLHHTHHRTMM